MVVNNQSSGTVNWSQGTAPLPEERLVVGQSGQLVSGGKTGNLTPSGKSPWVVTFSNGSQSAPSVPFCNADAEVTLNSDWTVTVKPLVSPVNGKCP
jgi:hypothetical protein